MAIRAGPTAAVKLHGVTLWDSCLRSRGAAGPIGNANQHGHREREIRFPNGPINWSRKKKRDHHPPCVGAVCEKECDNERTNKKRTGIFVSVCLFSRTDVVRSPGQRWPCRNVKMCSNSSRAASKCYRKSGSTSRRRPSPNGWTPSWPR